MLTNVLKAVNIVASPLTNLRGRRTRCHLLLACACRITMRPDGTDGQRNQERQLNRRRQPRPTYKSFTNASCKTTMRITTERASHASS